MTIELFYVTHPNKETADKISKACITQKLAACTNVFSVESCYEWKNEIQNDNEWVSIIKTIPEKANQLSGFIQSFHPYEVPCIIHYPVQVNEEYGEWVKNCIEP